jgi:phosphoribosyl 1,2-cyclic phosphodiesterase
MKIDILASGSEGNCYMVSDGETKTMIEAGLPIRKIRGLSGFKLREVSACLVSHDHGDHSKAIPNLMRSGLDCYMSAGTARKTGSTGHRLHILEPMKQISIDSWTLLPFPVDHDAEEPMGFLLGSGREKLLYVTDTATIPYKFPGLTHIMVECNYQEKYLQRAVADGKVTATERGRIILNHMSLETLVRWLGLVMDRNSLQQIHLLHGSKRHGQQDEIREAVEVTGGGCVKVFV